MCSDYVAFVVEILKLRLPICEIYQFFRSLVYFILPFTDLRNFSYRKKFSHHEVEVSQNLAKKMQTKLRPVQIFSGLMCLRG